jgi:polyhydroxyalkanoate synthesis regulator phasin
MFETLDKMMLAGLGAVSMTREKAEKIFDEYVSRGKVEKDARSGFIKELMDSAEKTKNDLEKMIADQTAKTIEKLKLANKDDISRLEKKLDQLLKKE